MATTPLPLLSKLQLERIRPIREIVRPRSLSQCCAIEEMDERERMAMLPLHTGDCRKEGRCGRLKGRDGLVLFLRTQWKIFAIFMGMTMVFAFVCWCTLDYETVREALLHPSLRSLP